MGSYKQLALPVIALSLSFSVTAGALSLPAIAQQHVAQQAAQQQSDQQQAAQLQTVQNQAMQRQDEGSAARTADAVTITAASPDSPVQQLVARETARH
jgi:hypothetical protein